MQLEKVLLLLAFAALAAIVLFRNKPQIADVFVEEEPSAMESGDGVLTPANTALGPDYLMYNQPWAFTAPVMNFLPATTTGQIGQVVKNPSAMQVEACGCEGH